MLECLVLTSRLSEPRAAGAIDEHKASGKSRSAQLEGARWRAAAYSQRPGFPVHFSQPASASAGDSS